MNKLHGIEKLLDPTKLKREWDLFLVCDVLPDRCPACKLQYNSIFQDAKISNDAAVVTTKALIDQLLPFKELQLGRPKELDDGIETRDNCGDACANHVLVV